MAALKNKRYSDKEYRELYFFAMQNDNLQAATEIDEHFKFFGKTVEVVAGRKVPHGTTGEVFYLARMHFSASPWEGWTTRVGIKDDRGNVFFTDVKNIKKINEAAGKNRV